MEVLFSLVQILALLSVSALCLYLIVVLVRLKETLTAVQRDLSDITVRAKPVLENLSVITESLKSVSAKVDEQVGIVGESLESLRGAAADVVSFQRRMQETLEAPIVRVGVVFGAIMDRLAAFFQRSQE